MQRPGYYFPVFLVIIIFAVFVTGCTDDDNPVDSGPPIPTSPSPAPDAVDTPIQTVLKWTYAGFDPATDYFNLYFGAENPPPLVDSNLTDTVYEIYQLLGETEYYWRVSAHPDGEDSVLSPVWKFTTVYAFSFPFTIGNTWSYQREYASINYEPDSLEDTHSFNITSTATTEITVPYTLNDTLPTHVFQTDWVEGLSNGTHYNYRTNTAEGLFSHGYGGSPWVGPPKRRLPDGIYLEFGGQRFESFEELSFYFRNAPRLSNKNIDSIFYENHPIMELKYPLEVGQHWLYRIADLGDAWNMDKTVLSTENVTVPAGQFECMKIQWRWDIDGDDQWDDDIDGYDYICDSGYVKRNFIFYDILVTNEYGDTLGTIDSHDLFELTDYQLQ